MSNALSFGELSKFYLYSKPDIKSKISHEFDKINEGELADILRVMTKYRNVCAHGERLYSYVTRDCIPDMPIHTQLNLPKNGTQFAFGKLDLFSQVISFMYLLSANDFQKFTDSLVKIIKGFTSKSQIINENSLLAQMHFPNNWEDMILSRIQAK